MFKDKEDQEQKVIKDGSEYIRGDSIEKPSYIINPPKPPVTPKNPNTPED